MARFNPEIDLAAIAAGFRGLSGRHPGLWPRLPRAALLAAIAAAVLGAAWALFWSGMLDELEARRAEEARLRRQYVEKMKQAVNLPVLREQKELVSRYVRELERQLPSRAEMDALLSDINQAGTGRGLQFELFRPGQVVMREHHAELPISIRLTGSYHDFASFASDVANLPRIVTLHDLRIGVADRSAAGARAMHPAGPLVMEATVRTFRYLDADEIAERQRAASAAAKSGGRAKAGSAAGTRDASRAKAGAGGAG